MQTTLENKGWARASRFVGAMDYYRQSLGRTLILVVLVLMALEIVSGALTALTDSYVANGVMANFSGALLLSFVCACWIARKGTTFLTRFGTPRTSAWLGGLCSLWLLSIAFLLLTLVMSVALSGVTLLLCGAFPERFQMVSYYVTTMPSAEVFTSTLASALRELPWQILWLVEWSCMFYFVGACLRRNRWLTIGALVGLPIALMLTMLIPAVRQTIAAVETASQSELAMLGMRFLAWFGKVGNWAAKNWQWVQAGLAVISLPLGWLVARKTAQP